MKIFTLCVVFVCYFTRIIVGSSEELPIVRSADGDLQGFTQLSRAGREYQSFLGIPYAQPPERFQVSKPVLKWSGVRKATEMGAVCVQDVWLMDHVQTVDGSEDCLFLNIQTPKSKITEKFPVIVFFHGGGFNFGSGNAYEGKYFMDHDIVFVTVNYRVGAFGFLDTEDGTVAGNFGMKDQVLALKWVKRNIESFGGDPNKVTIAGHSAGSASVMYHMTSPLSRGLFHRVIALSGSSISPWALSPKPKYFAQRLGAKLNCPTGNSEELIDCLKTKDAREFSEQHFRRFNFDTTYPFTPTIERKSPSNSDTSDVFANENQFTLLQDGKFAKVPVLLGITENEGLFHNSATVLQSEKCTRELDEDWKRVAPITFLYDKDERNLTEMQQNEWSRRIREFYFKDKKVGMDTIEELTNCYSDRWFVHSVRTTAILLANRSTKESPVFTYLLSYRGENPVLDILGVQNSTGIFSTATHADELQFLFNTQYFPKPLNKKSEEFSKRLVETCVEFCQLGQFIVDGKQLKPLLPNREPDWYELNDDPVKLIKTSFTERMKFWDEILNYNIQFEQGKTEL